MGEQVGGFEHCMDGGRGAVIGKVHRLNLPKKRPDGSYTDSVARTHSPHKPKRPRPKGRPSGHRRSPPMPLVMTRHAAPIEDLVVPISLKVSLLALNGQMCKWPIGDPREASFQFCGHRNFNSLPYCEYHARLSYTPRSKQRQPRRAAEQYLAETR